MFDIDGAGVAPAPPARGNATGRADSTPALPVHPWPTPARASSWKEPRVTRGYDDTVHVRLGDARPDGRRPPAQFLWHGRLYLVREVLGYWRERQAWWSLEPARAVHGEGCTLGAVPPGRPGGTATATRPAPSRLAQVGADREVWRVEAASGRSCHPGVYQLACDAAAPVPTGGARIPDLAPERTWRLLRVQD